MSLSTHEQIMRMQVLMLETATGSRPYQDSGEYANLWGSLSAAGAISFAPTLVKTARTISEFDSFIRTIPTYRERRQAIAEATESWCSQLEGGAEASDKYTIGKQIGDGGFSDVFEARDTQLGRKVAVKIFKPGNTAFSSALDHARSLARIDHPNVVTIFELVSVLHPVAKEIRSAIVMQFLEGPELATVLKERPSLAQANMLCRGILSGLQALHSVGLAHADLHDQNIKLDKYGAPKILDILYRGTLATKTAEVKGQYFRDDIIRAVDILGQIIAGVSLSSAVTEFRRFASDATTVSGVVDALNQALGFGDVLKAPKIDVDAQRVLAVVIDKCALPDQHISDNTLRSRLSSLGIGYSLGLATLIEGRYIEHDGDGWFSPTKLGRTYALGHRHEMVLPEDDIPF